MIIRVVDEKEFFITAENDADRYFLAKYAQSKGGRTVVERMSKWTIELPSFVDERPVHVRVELQ